MGSSVDRTQSNDRINESQDMPIENSQTEKQREKEKKKKRIELGESTCLTSDSITNPQSSRQYDTGTKTEI